LETGNAPSSQGESPRDSGSIRTVERRKAALLKELVQKLQALEKQRIVRASDAQYPQDISEAARERYSIPAEKKTWLIISTFAVVRAPTDTTSTAVVQDARR